MWVGCPFNICQSAAAPTRRKPGCGWELDAGLGAVGRVTRAGHARINRARVRNVAPSGAGAKLALTEPHLSQIGVKSCYAGHVASHTSRRSYSTNPCRT